VVLLLNSLKRNWVKFLELI